MARYTVQWPPEGYRFAQDHEGRWHIERQREDGLWADFAGPYRQRGSANQRMRRLRFRETLDAAARTMRHAPDCPVTLARALLGEETQ